MTSPEADWRCLTAEFVLHFHKTPSQVSRICGCGIPAVRQCVAEHMRQGIAPDTAADEASPFLPVTLNRLRSRSVFLSTSSPRPA